MDDRLLEGGRGVHAENFTSSRVVSQVYSYPDNRRYQLSGFATYLARNELRADADDRRGVILNALKFFADKFRRSGNAGKPLVQEYAATLVGLVGEAVDPPDGELLDSAISLARNASGVEPSFGRTLLDALTKAMVKITDDNLLLELLAAVGSPYTIGTPVRPPYLFGREATLQVLEANFDGRHAGAPAVYLRGPRRIGKTSILQTIVTQQPFAGALAVYLSAEMLHSRIGIVANTLEGLCRALLRAKPSATGADETALYAMRKEFDARPFQTFEIFLKSARQEWLERMPIFCMDEFDVLTSSDAPGVDALFRFFRLHVQEGTFGLIMAGVRSIARIEADGAVSPFIGVVVEHKIGPLQRVAAEALLAEPLLGFLTFVPEAIDMIVANTGGHPMTLQAVAHRIVRLALSERTRRVTMSLALRAMHEVTEETEYYFEYQFESLSEAGRTLLQWFARSTDASDSVVELATIGLDAVTGSIDDSGHTAGEVATGGALQELIESGALILESGARVRFTMPLFWRWLRARV